MLLYRLASARFPALDGEGARRHGGRWNSQGVALVYTASSLSLAILETRVHLRSMPIDYVRYTIEIPSLAYNPTILDEDSLGIGWQTNVVLTREVGDLYFARQPDRPLQVPSVVAEDEWNILFTPAFAARHTKIVAEQAVELDPRLWQ